MTCCIHTGHGSRSDSPILNGNTAASQSPAWTNPARPLMVTDASHETQARPLTACASRQRRGKRSGHPTGLSHRCSAFPTPLWTARAPPTRCTGIIIVVLDPRAGISLARVRRVGKTGSYQAGHLVGLPEHPIVVGTSIGWDIASERRPTSSATVGAHRPAECAPRQRQPSSAPVPGHIPSTRAPIWWT